MNSIGKTLGILVLLAANLTTQSNAELYSLCYHDVRDNVLDRIDADPFALSTDKLIQHFNWLKAHGYQPVSIDDILAARAGTRALPEKAVLLTFDDGYKSFYTKIFPVLKLFDYPAVYALVGAWLEYGPNERVPYGERLVPRENFLSWAEIRELQASKLISFASHSYDLHQGILANVQGNSEPSATTRKFNKQTYDYETAQEYSARITTDLKKNIEFFVANGLPAPRAMVWPYGRYNATSAAIAESLGTTISLTLDDKENTVPFDYVHRYLIHGNPGSGDIIAGLRAKKRNTDKLRIAQVDMDYLYDPDPKQQDLNLGQLLDRIKAMEITTVFLQAYADPDGDDNADALYFPNRHLPMRADLFNRVAWQLSRRANVAVYGWLPISAYSLSDENADLSLRVVAAEEGAGSSGPRRWSIFEPRARDIIQDIYADLAVQTGVLDGILFHDDGVLGDYEDDSAVARAAYSQAGFALSVAEIRANQDMFTRWSRFKTNALIEFTEQLASTARKHHPRLKTARSLFANTILEPASEAWFAQNLDSFLQHYDHPIVMAMPYMEDATQPTAWLTKLVQTAKLHEGALNRTVFQLQTIDWRVPEPVSMAALREQFDTLRLLGVRHMAYYPDSYIDGHPEVPIFRETFSSSDFYPVNYR